MHWRLAGVLPPSPPLHWTSRQCLNLITKFPKRLVGRKAGVALKFANFSVKFRRG